MTEDMIQWLAAKAHLEAAVSRFLEACVKLKDGTIQSLQSSAKNKLLNQTLQNIHSYRESREMILSQIEESQRVLNTLVNMSPSRAPVNRLPADLLSRIFLISIAITPCAGNDTFNPDALRVLPLVCRRWYHVAVDSPRLWTHIDLSASNSDKKRFSDGALLGLDRSRTLPIHLHLPKSANYWNANSSEIIDTLQPHMKRAVSVNIHDDTSSHFPSDGSTRLVRDIFSLFASQGSCHNLRVLVVSELHLWDHEYPIAWPTGPFPQLTELCMESLHGPTSPSLDELVTLLSNCPMLRILKLCGLSLRTNGRQEYSTIHLRELKKLYIRRITGEALALIAPLINASSNKLEITVDPIFFTTPEVECLLRRCCITTLTLHGCGIPDQATSSLNLACVPHLVILALNLSHVDEKTTMRRLLNYLSVYDSTSELLQLQEMVVISGRFRPEVTYFFWQILERIDLRRLVLINSRFSEHSTYSDSETEDVNSTGIPYELEKLVNSKGGEVLELYEHPGYVYRGLNGLAELRVEE